jgi:hypothetical protein
MVGDMMRTAAHLAVQLPAMVLEEEQDHVQETCDLLQARIAAATAEGAAVPAAGRPGAMSACGHPETGSTCRPCQPGPCIGMLWLHSVQAQCLLQLFLRSAW